MSPLLACENLVKIYRVGETEVVALQGLELSVDRGEIVGVVGTSGSGKSTLLSTIGGFTTPSAGRVLFDGIDQAGLRGRALDNHRRTELGFVHQDTTINLVPHLTAAQNVQLPMAFGRLGRTGRAGRRRADELLRLVGLADQANRRPGQLSGGQQQRVAIAVALARRPSLVLADEPTGELDRSTADQIHRLFRRVADEFGTAHLIVSHDAELAGHVDRVVLVQDGRLAAETRTDSAGRPADVALVDRGGRIQIPERHREALGITDRVRIEAVDGWLRLSVPDRNEANDPGTKPAGQEGGG